MMVQTLEDDGFTMVPFGQGFRDMSPPTKELMRLVLEREAEPWLSSGTPMEYGQRFCADRSSRESEDRQGKIHGESRRCGGAGDGSRPGNEEYELWSFGL